MCALVVFYVVCHLLGIHLNLKLFECSLIFCCFLLGHCDEQHRRSDFFLVVHKSNPPLKTTKSSPPNRKKNFNYGLSRQHYTIYIFRPEDFWVLQREVWGRRSFCPRRQRGWKLFKQVRFFLGTFTFLRLRLGPHPTATKT